MTAYCCREARNIRAPTVASQNGNQHTQHHHDRLNGNDGTESAPAKQEVARKTAPYRGSSPACVIVTPRANALDNRSNPPPGAGISKSWSPLRGQSLKRFYRRRSRGAPPMLRTGLNGRFPTGILAHAPRRQRSGTCRRCRPTRQVGFGGRTTHAQAQLNVCGNLQVDFNGIRGIWIFVSRFVV